MRTFRKLTGAVMLAIGFAVAAPSMADTTVTVEKTGKHHYVYYADHQIYFAPETKTYYWREGDAWRSGVELPPSDREYITTGGVNIELDTERPYERNEWVIQHYKNGHRDRDDDDHR